MTPRGLLITCVFATAALACRGDHGIDSDLPGDLQGSALSDSEQTQLCAAGDVYLDDQFTAEEEHDLTCLAQADQTDSCDSVQSCLDDGGQVPKRRACSLPLAWSTCDATVAEIEACWTDIFDLRGEYYEELTCPAKGPLPDDFGEACNRIEARCPRFPP